MDIFLEKVVATSEQVKQLYSQLKRRIHKISHNKLPSFDEHVKFVENNPYREWFVIKRKEIDIGNLYVQFDNSIGLYCDEDISSSQLKELLKLLMDNIKPLESILSVRSGNFFLNIASTDVEIQRKLTSIGYIEIQRSYALPILQKKLNAEIKENV